MKEGEGLRLRAGGGEERRQQGDGRDDRSISQAKMRGGIREQESDCRSHVVASLSARLRWSPLGSGGRRIEEFEEFPPSGKQCQDAESCIVPCRYGWQVGSLKLSASAIEFTIVLP